MKNQKKNLKPLGYINLAHLQKKTNKPTLPKNASESHQKVDWKS